MALWFGWSAKKPEAIQVAQNCICAPLKWLCVPREEGKCLYSDYVHEGHTHTEKTEFFCSQQQREREKKLKKKKIKVW